MNQDDLVRSLNRHLDAIEKSVELALILALVFVWAGIHKEDSITVFSVKVQRTHAFHVACVAYSAMNVLVMEKFLRIGDMVRLLDPDKVLIGATSLFVHPWALNPFSYFGRSAMGRFNSAKGFGLLIVSWWICLSSLYPFLERADVAEARIFQVAFFSIGVVTIFAITRAIRILTDALRQNLPQMAGEFERSNRERTLSTFVGFAVGGVISYVVTLM